MFFLNLKGVTTVNKENLLSLNNHFMNPGKKIGNKIAKYQLLFPTKIGIYQRFYPDISPKIFSRFRQIPYIFKTIN